MNGIFVTTMPSFQGYIRILHVYVLERQEPLQVVVNRLPKTPQTSSTLEHSAQLRSEALS